MPVVNTSLSKPRKQWTGFYWGFQQKGVIPRESFLEGWRGGRGCAHRQYAAEAETETLRTPHHMEHGQHWTVTIEDATLQIGRRRNSGESWLINKSFSSFAFTFQHLPFRLVKAPSSSPSRAQHAVFLSVFCVKERAIKFVGLSVQLECQEALKSKINIRPQVRFIKMMTGDIPKSIKFRPSTHPCPALVQGIQKNNLTLPRSPAIHNIYCSPQTYVARNMPEVIKTAA